MNEPENASQKPSLKRKTDKFSIRENVSLASYTTLQIGGLAKYFAEVTSEEELKEAIEFAKSKAVPIFVLGGGSNIVVSDQGYPGLVIHIGIKGIDWNTDNNGTTVTSAAGENWDDLVQQCIEKGLSGTECLVGIPGSVGAAPVQNIGAYGQEVHSTVVSLSAFDRKDGNFCELTNAACQFGYRSSLFNTTERERYIILSVKFQLTPATKGSLTYPDIIKHFESTKLEPTLRNVSNAVRTIRSAKGMLITPEEPNRRSVGSFFKNVVATPSEFQQVTSRAREQGILADGQSIPQFPAKDGYVKIPAAWLVEQAGIVKGYSRGTVAISSKHTLALVNKGGATAADLLELMKEVQMKVKNVFGVSLLNEPVFVGF